MFLVKYKLSLKKVSLKVKSHLTVKHHNSVNLIDHGHQARKVLVVYKPILKSLSLYLLLYDVSTVSVLGNNNPYFSKFMVSLLRSFSSDRHHLLEDRGAFIIRQLCVLLNSEDIYRTLAEILLHEEDLKFASIMVETLNTILLTSSELFDLRTKLKDLNSEVSCSSYVMYCILNFGNHKASG